MFENTGIFKPLFFIPVFFMPFFIIPVVYLPIYARGARPGDTGAKNGCHRSTVELHFAPLRRPTRRFLTIFGHYRATQKNRDFSNRLKPVEVAESIDRGASKAHFFIKKQVFWEPIWLHFFVFFQKLRKCEISEEYNAKRASEPSKTFHFGIDVSSHFRCFSEPSPRANF